jgi:hypothetical protein
VYTSATLGNGNEPRAITKEIPSATALEKPKKRAKQ